MIFVCLGTQEFQFDRLLKEIDQLIQDETIKENVFAQIGYSLYKPVHFDYKQFISFDEFEDTLEKSSFVITHGGTGTIVKALKKGKKVIGVPRLKQYNEHVDDHQKELIAMFSQKKLIYGINDVQELHEAIRKIGSFNPQSYVSGNSKIISTIENYLNAI